PALIPRRAGDRVKTDRRDAVKLARLYRSGELTMIRVPDREQEGVRDLVRTREDVRKDLIAAKHRLAKILLRHRRTFSETRNSSEKQWRWIRGQEFDSAAELTTFQHYVLQVEQVLRSKGVKQLLGRRERRTSETPKGESSRLLSDRAGRPGLAPFRARQL